MRSYRVQYAEDIVKLGEAVTELNRQAIQRNAHEFRIVAIAKEESQWAAMLEREIDSSLA